MAEGYDSSSSQRAVAWFARTLTVVPMDFERQNRAAALIPKGPPLAQSIFKSATCLAYALGEAIADALELGTYQAQEENAQFVPVYDPALLRLDD